jgi:hypothetical protein
MDINQNLAAIANKCSSSFIPIGVLVLETDAPLTIGFGIRLRCIRALCSQTKEAPPGFIGKGLITAAKKHSTVGARATQ